MTNRVQTLRSSSAGVRPSGQPPGMLYVNFPDMQLGVANASSAATDLLAVRYFSSLAAYAIGDYVLQAGVLYRCTTANGPGAFNAGNWSKLLSVADISAAYAPLANPVFTGDPQAPTPATADNDTSIATTAFVKAQAYAVLASPTFTGDPQAPTPAVGDNDTSIATTAFVKAQFPIPESSVVNLVSDLALKASGSGNAMRRNGGLELWQRGAGGAASFSVPASTTQYGPDGWYITTTANQAYTVSQVAGITNGSQWAAKVQRNAGQTGVGQIYFGFPLDTDELYPLLGQYICVSFTAKAGANWSPASGALGMAVYVGTGTPNKFLAFTGSVLVAGNVFNLTTTPTRYQLISSAPVPLTARQLEVFAYVVPVGTAGADDSFTIDDVQLEIVPAASGYVASAFQRLNFQEQLTLCQRHFGKTFPYAVAPAFSLGTASGEDRWSGVVVAAGAVVWQHTFPTLMRVAPSGVIWNTGAANAQIRNQSLGSDCSGSAFSFLSAREAQIAGVAPASSVAGNVYGAHITFDAGI